MEDADRIIGQLEQFKSWAEDEFQYIRSELAHLNEFKWRIYGGSAIISTIMVICIELILRLKNG